jgi:hypothetical protein
MPDDEVPADRFFLRSRARLPGPRTSHSGPHWSSTRPRTEFSCPRKLFSCPCRSFTRPRTEFSCPRRSFTRPRRSFMRSRRSFMRSHRSFTRPEERPRRVKNAPGCPPAPCHHAHDPRDGSLPTLTRPPRHPCTPPCLSLFTPSRPPRPVFVLSRATNKHRWPSPAVLGNTNWLSATPRRSREARPLSRRS